MVPHQGCVCTEGWSGDFCEAYIAHQCWHTCDWENNACAGPEPTDCTSCHRNAHFIDQKCVCNADFTSSNSSSLGDCQLYVGLCAPICSSCNGPSETDCLQCKENAFLHRGACKCKEGWSGDDCSYGGRLCAPACQTCQEETLDCIKCVQNAYWIEEGICQCLIDWNQSPNCTGYNGVCADTCDHNQICFGPSNTDCNGCAEHAYHDPYTGACLCAPDWSLHGCQTYGGMCDARCTSGCSSASDCYPCQETEYQSSSCECRDGWTGPACRLYYGECHKYCRACSGPKETDCTEFVLHAGINVSTGSVECETGWGGPFCALFTGFCDPTCAKDSCSGPSEFECQKCNSNAIRGHDGACECLPNYHGPGCSSYAGLCSPMCLDCSGPLAISDHCLTPVDNALPNPINGVDFWCAEGWYGPTCELFGGLCNPLCKGCFGPSAKECIKCIKNAERKYEHECACITSNSTVIPNQMCEIALVQCDPVCASCYGTSSSDCTQCVANAFRDDTGACVCLPDYNGFDCSVYIGECFPRCGQCNGPSVYECLPYKCNTDIEAYWDEIARVCRCTDDYSGDRCDYYSGKCNPLCHGCTGPTDLDCFKCHENAGFNDKGACVCSPGFMGTHCNAIATRENCHATCNTCTGPQKNQCKSCHSGNYLTSKETCMPCHGVLENCEYCSLAGDVCIYCAKGFHTTQDGKCIPCAPECASCSGVMDYCTSCFEGFELVSIDEERDER